MYAFTNGGRIVQSVDELPDLRNAKILYADFETTSGDPKKKSTDPYHNCDVAGIAITVDDEFGAWYIPVGHHNGDNLPREAITKWWRDVVNTAGEWHNHNIKYDAHVSENCLGVLPTCNMVCTLTQAKLIDSDKGARGGYSLDALSRDWLKENISQYNKVFAPYVVNNKDWGAIPIDIMGEYACQDVITNRRISKYCISKLPDQCKQVSITENALTTVLFHIEREGMTVDPQQLKIAEYKLLKRMLEIDVELTEIVGRSFRPHVSDDCYDVLCNQYGLPVLAWTQEDEDGEPAGNPSFDKATLVQYNAHPFAPEGVVPLIQEYRRLHILNSLFVTKYQELHVNNVMHPSYNQCVRTGRLSCKRPNAQQLSAAAKLLVIPPDGYSFISIDYSQIEFRIIVHYIKDTDAINAYKKDPDTDFHQWVADMCEISRRPAKTVNFLIAFGGGKALVQTALASNMELVGPLKEQVNKALEAGKITEDKVLMTFNYLAQKRAIEVYDTYHATLPSLKRTARQAGRAVDEKGFVFNLYGRHRHLPADKSHIAFNTLCQSSAADLMKERTVACYEAIQNTPIKIIASVHDETLFIAPHAIANDLRTVRDLTNILEHPPIELRVPIRCASGISAVNWKEASSTAKPIQYDSKVCEDLKWLK